jgi:hypothetical protein
VGKRENLFELIDIDEKANVLRLTSPVFRICGETSFDPLGGHFRPVAKGLR